MQQAFITVSLLVHREARKRAAAVCFSTTAECTLIWHFSSFLVTRLALYVTVLCSMAEAVGLASGLLTLASFALQSSLTLYNTIQSFRSHLKRVQSLVEEVGALNDILSSLDETIRAVTDVDLSLLDLPLLRCGRACRDFEQELIKCSSRSGGDRTSFRDWAKLRYMSDDIDGFTRLLAGYKSIINIALVDANL